MLINGIGRRENASDINRTRGKITDNLKSLSTGKELNSAADGAAALSMYEELEAELASHNQAGRNISYGGSLTSIADSALGTQGEILGRMRELAVQSANGTLGDSGRSAIQNEFDALRGEFDRIASITEHNGQNLLQGGSLEIQAGIGSDSSSRITMNIPDTQAGTLGLGGLDLNSAVGAQAALADLDTAISTIGSARAELGATANRLGFAESANETSVINKARSAGTLGDANIAEEASSLSKNRFLMRMAIHGQSIANDARGSLLDLIA